MNKESKDYISSKINYMLDYMIPSPTKKARSYYSTINMWTNIDGYTLDYVYFVVHRVYHKSMSSHVSYTIGYFRNCLKDMVDDFDAEINKPPFCGTREELLKAGHTVESLPYDLLTKEEKKVRKEGTSEEFSVTDEDRASLTAFLGRVD